MHQSSYNIMSQFRNLVMKHFNGAKVSILDVGSYGVNGTYKEIFSDENMFNYTGLDLQQGLNVDYVPADPYSWPELKDETFDVIISGQAFEHIEFPWIIINEMKKKLKKNGLICIVAPSRGPEHKYPVDCWRYYPDGFRALAKWVGMEVLEAKTNWGASGFTDGSDQWGDSFCILWKDGAQSPAKNTEHLTLKARRNLNKNNPLETGKTALYYSFARGEIIDAIVKNGLPAKRVLEIGCAGGATGKKLKETLPVDYYAGVEIFEHAAVIARQRLDRVIVADIEKTDLVDYGLKHGDFDLLLVLDVLEHLYNPWDVLADLRRFLKPGGHVIASIPNIQNITIVSSLVHGRWRYESAGILDATHVRFFTMEEIERLFSGAGLPITKTEYVLNPPVDVSKIKDSGNNLTHENISLANLNREEVLRLFVYQYIIIAKNAQAVPDDRESGRDEGRNSVLSAKQEAGTTTGQGIMSQPVIEKREPVHGLVSIVILTFNQLKYTKECIESIRKFTPEPHEIIFVDNNSKDGTVRWLKKLVGENQNYKIIENSKNLGFSKGCNQGLEAASGEFILLLNNDVVVTENWISGMIECLASAEDTGIVGPMTNNISGPQKVDTDYKTIQQMHNYAGVFREKNRHRRIPLRRIVGFCMLFRRSLVEKIGLLDESFGSGNFEDDDYCLRAELLGHRNVIAGDVFIHHYGSRSFIGNRIDYGSSISGNQKIFSDKWSGIDAQSPLGKRLLIVKALERAREFHHRGQADKVAETLLEGIKHAPEEQSIYYLFAEMLIDNKQFKDALEVLNEMPPHDSDAKKLALTGYCKEGLELYEEAGEYAERVLSLDASAASVLNLKGVLTYKQGDRGTAEGFFLSAIEAARGYGEPYTNLGVLKWAAGQHEEALGLLERGFILSPTNSDIVTTYHTAITASGAFSRAEAVFREAKTCYPLNKRIIFLLIDVLLQQEKLDSAMDEIEKAMLLFGIDDGILAAALEVRNRIGSQEINKTVKKKSALSLCMIVKNEEQYLARCLMSVKAVTDELIVVDTGSSDRTRDIATAFGAKVYDFPWTGDFSEARNFSLSKASGDWILVLDADEVISPQDHPVLSRLIAKRGKPTAYAFVTRNYLLPVYKTGWTANDGAYQEEAGTGWFGSVKVRLFPRDSRIQFRNPVHELVEPSLEKIGVRVKDCSIPIHHYGKLDQEKSTVKGEEYYLLGRKKLEETGEDADAIRELAIQAGELKRFAEAIELWQRAIKLRPDMGIAYINMASVYLQADRFSDALAAGKRAVEMDPDSKEAVCNYALCEMYAGDAGRAIAALQGLLKKDPAYPSANIMLAIAHICADRKDEGKAVFTSLRISGPAFAESVYPFARKLVIAGRVDYAVALLDAAIENNAKREDIFALRAECRRLSGQVVNSTNP